MRPKPWNNRDIWCSGALIADRSPPDDNYYDDDDCDDDDCDDDCDDDDD